MKHLSCASSSRKLNLAVNTPSLNSMETSTPIPSSSARPPHAARNRPRRIVLAWAALILLALLSRTPCAAQTWNGAGSVTNNNFSNTNNWIWSTINGTVVTNGSINGVSVNFGALATGATNTAYCNDGGNSATWTFNSGTPAMVITIQSGQQMGADGGPDVFINNSSSLQTINGYFTLFDIGGTSTTTRRFNTAAGPLTIAVNSITMRGDSSPTTWAIELGGSDYGILNCGGFSNGGNLTGKNVNYVKTGTGT